MRPTAKQRFEQFRAALTDIAAYTFAVYRFEGKEYVPVQEATYLRALARDALVPPRKEP